MQQNNSYENKQLKRKNQIICLNKLLGKKKHKKILTKILKFLEEIKFKNFGLSISKCLGSILFYEVS